jgi:hypothetical protein
MGWREGRVLKFDSQGDGWMWMGPSIWRTMFSAGSQGSGLGSLGGGIWMCKFEGGYLGKRKRRGLFEHLKNIRKWFGEAERRLRG